MPRMPRRCALLFSLAVFLSPCPAGPPATVIPPEPAFPDTTQLAAPERDAAFDHWIFAWRAWSKSLTADQHRTHAIAMAVAARKDEGDAGEPPPSSSAPEEWRNVAAREFLTTPARDRLATHKVLLGQRAQRQMFEFYTSPRTPTFITSDSLLNAFHGLLEETFRDLELSRAGQLRVELEKILVRVRALLADPPCPASELAPAWAQAQRAVGPALVILGTPLDRFDAAVRTDISAEVALIRAAAAV